MEDSKLMQKEFHELKSKVDDIHRILLGNDHEQEIGMLPRLKNLEYDVKSLKDLQIKTRIEEMEKDVKELKQTFFKIKWIAIGALAPASYGVYDIIQEILKSLLK